MLRPQDVLFGIFGLALLVLAAFNIGVVVLALVGAFACGAIYLLAGMLPSRHEGFWSRVFTSVFLSIVCASLVLILPGTLGPHVFHAGAQRIVIAIAGSLPLLAICFEVVRTPRVMQGILRCFGHR